MNLKVMLFVVSILILSVSIVGSNALPQVPVNDPNSRAYKTLDDKFLEVAEKVPGFGGMFKDGMEMKVYLVNPAQRHDAEERIASVFGRERIPSGGIQVLQGQYSFSQLKKWHDSMGTIFEIPGVIFTDVDESSNRLKVGVESLNSSGVVEQELIKQGIPRDAFIIEKTEPIVFAATLRDRIRPIQGGIEIAFQNNPTYYYICTLGFNGVRSGVKGFVVNSHCTYNQGGVDDTVYYQPTLVDVNLIGTEIADPPYLKCGGGKKCRYSDSAYAARADGVPANIGYIARPDSVNTGSLNIAGNFRIVSEGSSIVGDSVNKVGRTTGWTQGTVTNTCVDTIVSGTSIEQLCQTFVNAGVGGGDSGSPVFKITDNPEQYDVQLLGILWGSSGGTSFVYSPMTNIENELGQINTTVYNYVHTLVNPVGGPVTDTVSSSIVSFYGVKTTFKWTRPNSTLARSADVSLSSNQYFDSMTPDVTGTWNITTTEYDNSNNQVNNGYNPSQTSFTATINPEFGSLGLLIPLFLAGIFYLQLRRKIL